MSAAKVTLTDAERGSLAEPVYDAYRLGKYGKQEYLPMWHELDHQQPPNSFELERVIDAVEAIVAAKIAEALREAAVVLVKNGPVLNYELNPDGTEDRERAAYVEGHRDSVTAIRALADSYDGGVS